MGSARANRGDGEVMVMVMDITFFVLCHGAYRQYATRGMEVNTRIAGADTAIVLYDGVFHTYFYNHANRLRLEKLLYLGPIPGKNHPKLKMAMPMRSASFPAF
jgi:hypothetical protein